jgi:hypothetical protein
MEFLKKVFDMRFTLISAILGAFLSSQVYAVSWVNYKTEMVFVTTWEKQDGIQSLRGSRDIYEIVFSDLEGNVLTGSRYSNKFVMSSPSGHYFSVRKGTGARAGGWPLTIQGKDAFRANERGEDTNLGVETTSSDW